MSEGITVVDNSPPTQFTYGDYIQLKSKKVSNLELRGILATMKVFLRKFNDETNILDCKVIINTSEKVNGKYTLGWRVTTDEEIKSTFLLGKK